MKIIDVTWQPLVVHVEVRGLTESYSVEQLLTDAATPARSAVMRAILSIGLGYAIETAKKAELKAGARYADVVRHLIVERGFDKFAAQREAKAHKGYIADSHIAGRWAGTVAALEKLDWAVSSAARFGVRFDEEG